MEKTLIPYSHTSTSSSPIGMTLTQFHCILLYRDRYIYTCQSSFSNVTSLSLLPFTNLHVNLPTPYSFLYPPYRVEAICVLNQQRVYEDLYNIRRDGALHALCMDPCDATMYTYQKHKVWIYTPYNETRLVVLDVPCIIIILLRNTIGLC